jgi:integrase
MTLDELVRVASAEVSRSRRANLKSLAKQYARMLGTDLEHCPPETYHMPADERNTLIEMKHPPHWQANTVRNCKSTIAWLLTFGESQGYLAPQETLFGWRTRRRITEKAIARRVGEVPQDLYRHHTRYGLHPLAETAPELSTDLEAYLAWCQGKPRIPGRGKRHLPKRIKKNARSCASTREKVAAVAGYAVHVLGEDPLTLTLDRLTDPEFLESYAHWFIHERRGVYTVRLHTLLGMLKALRTHWLDRPDAEEIGELVEGLGVPVKVRDKEARWLSLQEVLQAAYSIYPFNERRLRESKHARMMLKAVQTHTTDGWVFKYHTMRRVCMNIQASLLLRLLCEFPWRQRQYREMELGTHLTKGPDGRWRLRFHGSQLKRSHRDGRENELTGTLSPENSAFLDEWVTLWRPFLMKASETYVYRDVSWPRATGEPKPTSQRRQTMYEAIGEEPTHVFLTQTGWPMTDQQVINLVKSATYRFTGVGLTPHLIRDIWATEYLQSHPGDYETVADRLGNTVPVVIRYYGHIQKEHAQAKAEAFNRVKFRSVSRTSS